MTFSLWTVRGFVCADIRRVYLCVVLDDPYGQRPSYFRLELELPEVGRVLRFSKIISAGMCFGWALRPKALIDVIDVKVRPIVTDSKNCRG
jgi:hypothetical protein